MAKDSENINKIVDAIMAAMSGTGEAFEDSADKMIKSTAQLEKIRKELTQRTKEIFDSHGKSQKEIVAAEKELLNKIDKIAQRLDATFRASQEHPEEVPSLSKQHVKYLYKTELKGGTVSDERVKKDDNSFATKIAYWADKSSEKTNKAVQGIAGGITSFFTSRNYWGRFVGGIVEGTRHLLKKGVLDLLLAAFYQGMSWVKSKWGTWGTRVALALTALVAIVGPIKILVGLVRAITGFGRILRAMLSALPLLAGGRLGGSFLRRGTIGARGLIGAKGGLYGPQGTPGYAGKGSSRSLGAFGLDVLDEKVTKEGSKVSERALAGVAKKEGVKAAEKGVAKGLGKSVLKKIPGVSLGAGLLFGATRAMEGDWLGAGMEVASGVAGTVPGIGTGISAGIDAALIGKDIHSAMSTPKASKTGENIFKEMQSSNKNVAKHMSEFSKWGRFLAVLAPIGIFIASIFEGLKHIPGFGGREKLKEDSEVIGRASRGTYTHVPMNLKDLSDKEFLKNENLKVGGKYKTRSIHGVQAVALADLGLYGSVDRPGQAAGNSLPYIAEENAFKMKVLDAYLASKGYQAVYTSAMGGHKEGTGHYMGRKVDVQLWKAGKPTRLTKEEEREIETMFKASGGTTGALGWEPHAEQVGGGHYDLSVASNFYGGSYRSATTTPVGLTAQKEVVQTTGDQHWVTAGKADYIDVASHIGPEAPGAPRAEKKALVTPEVASIGEEIDIQVAGMANLLNVETIMLKDFMF